MKHDVAFAPVDGGLLSLVAIVAQAGQISDLIEQFGRGELRRCGLKKPSAEER